MTDEEKAQEGQEPEVSEVDEKDMSKVAGGFNPQPEPPGRVQRVDPTDPVVQRLRSKVNPAE